VLACVPVQLYAIVPMSSLQCYPMGGYRTGGSFAAPPLTTGWGGFDGCNGCADCQVNTDVEGQGTFKNMGKGMYTPGDLVYAPQARRCICVRRGRARAGAGSG
jgi:hypothetical protein